MNNTDQSIQELANAFSNLKTPDSEIYTKALRALVDLALAEERLARARSIEDDLQQIGKIFGNSQASASSNIGLENRRVRDRRASVPLRDVAAEDSAGLQP
jgi:hypothetical protein